MCGGIAPLILNLCTIWRWSVSFMSLMLCPLRRCPLHPLTKMLDGCGSSGKKKSFVPPRNWTTIPQLPHLFLLTILTIPSRLLTLQSNTFKNTSTQYEVCPETIQPFWISREPVEWPWCNLAASQRRPYCASVNSHSPVGLVSRQWDAVDWACVLCDCRIHKSPPFQRWFYLWEKPEFAGSQI